MTRDRLMIARLCQWLVGSQSGWEVWRRIGHWVLWMRGLQSVQIHMILNLLTKVRKDLCFPDDDFDVSLSSRLGPLFYFFLLSNFAHYVFLLAYFVFDGIQCCVIPRNYSSKTRLQVVSPRPRPVTVPYMRCRRAGPRYKHPSPHIANGHRSTPGLQ
jgi:hypothetical protein